MMKGLKEGLVFGALLTGLCLTAPAGAAESLKMKTKAPKIEPLPKEKFAELRGQLGACIVSHNRETVKKYLAHSDSMTVDYKGMGVDPKMAMFMFRMESCTKYNVPQMMQPVFMTPGAMRNLLLEAAYLDVARTTPKPLLDANGEPALAPARSYATPAENLSAAVAYATLADCTAAKGTEQADAVLRTGAGLPEEREAAVALAPVIGACVQDGQNISLTPATIRGIAAEGLYQRYGVSNTAQASAK